MSHYDQLLWQVRSPRSISIFSVRFERNCRLPFEFAYEACGISDVPAGGMSNGGEEEAYCSCALVVIAHTDLTEQCEHLLLWPA
jgi:hypothetical protein